MALFSRTTSLIASLEAKGASLASESTAAQAAAIAYREAAIDAEKDSATKASQAAAVVQALGILNDAGVSI